MEHISTTRFRVHTGPPAKRSKSQAISQVRWNEFRPVIERKYVLENLTLSELSEYLYEKYDFFATARQYTCQFSKWQLKKQSNSLRGIHHDEVDSTLSPDSLDTSNLSDDKNVSVCQSEQSPSSLVELSNSSDAECDTSGTSASQQLIDGKDGHGQPAATNQFDNHESQMMATANELGPFIIRYEAPSSLLEQRVDVDFPTSQSDDESEAVEQMTLVRLREIIVSAGVYGCIGLEKREMELNEKVRLNVLDMLEQDHENSARAGSLVKMLLADLLQIWHVCWSSPQDIDFPKDRSNLLSTIVRLIRISCDQHLITGQLGLRQALLMANTMALQKLFGYHKAAMYWQEHLNNIEDRTVLAMPLVSAMFSTSPVDSRALVWGYFQQLSFPGMQDFLQWSLLTITSSRSYRDFIHKSVPESTGSFRNLEAGWFNGHMLFCGLHIAWAEFLSGQKAKEKRSSKMAHQNRRLLKFVKTFVLRTGLSVSDFFDIVAQLVVEEQGQLSGRLGALSEEATPYALCWDYRSKEQLVALQAAALLRLHAKLDHGFPHKFLVHRWLKTWMPGKFELRSTDLSHSVHLYQIFFEKWTSEHWQAVQDCESIAYDGKSAIEDADSFASEIGGCESNDLVTFKSLVRRFSDITMSSSNKSLDLPTTGLRFSDISSTASSLRKLLARHSTGTTSDRSLDRMSCSDTHRSHTSMEKLAAEVEILLQGGMPSNRWSTCTVLASESDIDWSQWTRHSIA